jgi:hypothetical protein
MVSATLLNTNKQFLVILFLTVVCTVQLAREFLREPPVEVRCPDVYAPEGELPATTWQPPMPSSPLPKSFQMFKNPGPKDVFVWGDPMPLLPAAEAEQYLKKDAGNKWISSHIRDQVKLRTKPVRVVSAFVFDCELDLLELRLRELNDTVDAFVLVESNYTQTGTPKHLHFWENRYRFQPYWSKIRYVVVWEGFKTVIEKDDWYNENLIAYALPKALRGLDDDDIVIGSDADEILSRDAAMFFRHYTGYPERTMVYLRWSQMGFFWHVSNMVWQNVFSVATYRLAKNDQLLRYKQGPWTLGSQAVHGGWHCSWCFPYQDFLNKYKNVGDSKWGKEQLIEQWTDETMAKARYEGKIIPKSEQYVFDTKGHPVAAMEQFKYLSDKETLPKCGWCRRVEQKEWLVANISMSDPVPQDLTERSSKCSNDVHLSATKTWPASRDQA